ncbi:hypothetical protein AURDEDRAFT_177768 [Auricularia subglabra TFB-10046 SS5]|uniref:Uncharacterized protein n=1 Tax=Auricularia subglabra (strain TFB-10046 / SS5) TaxID=717982 RepID=J0D3A3_AURST|nr:hypothetical protein AURDEDRAFT_177768 [Auricularia subglabra TFB-10046 SS5]
MSTDPEWPHREPLIGSNELSRAGMGTSAGHHEHGQAEAAPREQLSGSTGSSGAAHREQ